MIIFSNPINKEPQIDLTNLFQIISALSELGKNPYLVSTESCCQYKVLDEAVSSN